MMEQFLHLYEMKKDTYLCQFEFSQCSFSDRIEEKTNFSHLINILTFCWNNVLHPPQLSS